MPDLHYLDPEVRQLGMSLSLLDAEVDEAQANELASLLEQTAIGEEEHIREEEELELEEQEEQEVVVVEEEKEKEEGQEGVKDMERQEAVVDVCNVGVSVEGAVKPDAVIAEVGEREGDAEEEQQEEQEEQQQQEEEEEDDDDELDLS
jgi:hypothetical protein